MMKRCALFFVLVLLNPVIAPVGVSVSGQTPSTPPSQEQRVVIGTAEVLLDAVVKDKRGHAIKDLTAGDFEIYEDGVKQQIESFRLVMREAGKLSPDENPADSRPEQPRAAVRASGDASIGVSVVALVFDRLSLDARKRAQDAALSYLGDASDLNSYTGVFAINLSLNHVQNYTTDIGLVKKAVEKAGSFASSTFDSTTMSAGFVEDSARREALINSAGASAQAASAAGNGAAAAAAGAASGAASVDQQMAMMQERARETFEVLQRDQQGYATTNGLMAIVNSMQRLPGRKAVIFFSEGISIPPNVQQHFRSVINAANRANVSVYAVDAAGLRTDSPLKNSRDEINTRSQRRMDSLDQAMRNNGPLTSGLERNEDLLNLNPQSGLTQLAVETGGSFIGDTNQIGSKLKQVDEELNTYYLISYIPSNQINDGKFRNVSVKVRKSGAEVISRKGYYAVGSTGSSPFFYYEAQPLAILNGVAKPKDFQLLAAGLNFPESNRPGRTAIEIEAPAGAFTFDLDKVKKIYSTDFTFLALIRDQKKLVVDKISYHYVLVGQLDKADSARKSKILFYREIDLPPGRYELEAIAYDALGGKASVKQTSIDIPETDGNKLRLSSIAIIQRIEQIKEKMDSPFLVGDDVLVYPNLGEPIRKSAGKPMGFYFNVYPAKGSNESPKLLLEIFQGVKSFAKVPLKLSPPDQKGRIQYASALPLDSLGPGLYEMKITVSDSRGSVTRSSQFILEP